MAVAEFYHYATITLCLVSYVTAQEEIETCYGPGSIVGAIIGTLLITIALFASFVLLYKMYWRSRKGKHLVLVADAENPGEQYAFDNPCFREATPIKHNIHDEKNSSKLDKNRWLGWSPLNPFGGQKNEKVTSLDDSYINDSHLKVVTLKSHDFTGLGFNICGNMRDGIFVKDVLHRGPAFESGCINSGDRIDSVCISFRNMVFEDALTILSYASPYEVQVQVENDSYSRPSTLIRSKRESNAVSSAERIRHPKYNRSQSISHLAEIGKSNNKRMSQQMSYTSEKNRINQSLNKSQEYRGAANDYPTLKLSSSSSSPNVPKKENQKLEKTAVAKPSPSEASKHSPFSEQSNESQNKFQKFGIKVLPISINPKMGIQSVTGAKKSKDQVRTKPEVQTRPSEENESNAVKEKAETEKVESSDEQMKKADETDGSKENMKTIITKGFQNLKEKINQNTLGKKKNKEMDESAAESPATEKENENPKTNVSVSTGECPVPKVRSTVTCGVKAYEQNQTCSGIPEEVTRAGDVARNNRKSASDLVASPRRSVTNLVIESENKEKPVEKEKKKSESSSESSSDRDSPKSNDVKRPKRSKGKAPAPPQNPRGSTPSKQPSSLTSKEMNEIKKESDLEKNDIFEPIQSDMSKMEENAETNDTKSERSVVESYDSDSDTETKNVHLKNLSSGTKIELNATQVTIHHSPTSDTGNDDEIETSRKAASLGDLSKLDSDHTLSMVLERAVSLDLADGSSQCGKKRKAPLPPPEEFPAVFDDVGYRKEPRLENSLGLNTFQRRLKKSSDFGTLEDALQDGPKSLEIEVNKRSSPVDLTETYNTNIQEFSSWLAEVRRPKKSDDEMHGSTSLINVNVPEDMDQNQNNDEDNQFEYSIQGNNVKFSVNGKNLQDFINGDEISTKSQNFPGSNSRTVLVISQPNSIEPIISDSIPINLNPEREVDDSFKCIQSVVSENETTLEPFVTASESRLDANTEDEDADETPPKLPTTPMPVLTPTGAMSSPLSSSLTYITEIKVSTSEQDTLTDLNSSKESEKSPSLSSDSIACDDDDREVESLTGIVSSTPIVPPKRTDIVKMLSERNLIAEDKDSGSKPKPDRSISYNESVTVNHENLEQNRRASDAGYETSKIPIRTMKSETGQKVLATIQSLAAKESASKSPEIEYAKRVASLFSGTSPVPKNGNSRKGNGNENSHPNISGFYLKTNTSTPVKPPKEGSNGNRKVPPVVPPRKVETSLSSKSTVTVELPGKPQGVSQTQDNSFETDRNVVTFSSFMPRNKEEDSENKPRIASWNDNMTKEHGGINGGHMHMPVQTGVVNLPVKTSATKIVFENKDLENEEF